MYRACECAGGCGTSVWYEYVWAENGNIEYYLYDNISRQSVAIRPNMDKEVFLLEADYYMFCLGNTRLPIGRPDTAGMLLSGTTEDLLELRSVKHIGINWYSFSVLKVRLIHELCLEKALYYWERKDEKTI